MNYYPWNIGDYAAHTGHLEPMEDLIYRRLLDAYYLREKLLPADHMAVAKMIRLRSEAPLVLAILQDFFTPTPAGWQHARCEEEIAKMHDKQAKARASGLASANARKGRKPTNAERPLDEEATSVERSLASAPTDVQLPTPTPIPIPIPIPIPKSNLLTQICSQPAAENVEPSGEGQKVNGHHGHLGPGPPDCPHGQVLALWAEVMPDQPQHDPERWNGRRADQLRARWRETAAAKDWHTQAEGLAYLRKFFGWCRRSQFLMGKVPPTPGHRQFELELAWLVNPENWTKAHEGKYHPEG